MAQRVLILVGPPGSGKSTFAKRLCQVFPEIVRINQDDQGDRRACEELTLSALTSKDRKQSVVIDRCNFDADQRKVWIEIAQQVSVKDVEVIIMDTPYWICKKRILARSGHPTQVEGQQGVEILHKFMEMLTMPTYFEGITRIMRVPPQETEEYSDEAVKDIMAKLASDEFKRPDSLQAPRWQKEDFYFKRETQIEEEQYRAQRAAAAGKAASHPGSNTTNHHKLAGDADKDGFQTQKRHGHNQDATAPAPVRPPLFGAAGGGWRARQAAKLEKQEQDRKAAQTLPELAKPEVKNPFDLLGDDDQ
ncbi:hypothetical protein DFQ26_008500 [Actinomortierella ambigua]|nr:hypothetical protein DFQ26_008500 [Actinomortierella ambigua]